MRLFIAWLLCLPVLAQTQTPAAAQATPPAAAAAPQAPTQGVPAAAESPAPAPDGDWLTGDIELGYRWIPTLDGSLNTYRSIIDLGEGPKLIGADLTLRDPSHKYFDRADIHASSWGDEPYSSLRVDVVKAGDYRLDVDYRNMAYFNFLPSFANPGIGSGSLLDANSFDTRTGDLNAQLDLLPGRRISPYLAFSRDTDSGRGITSFVEDVNQYAVATQISNQTNNYRAGVLIDLGNGRLMLEQGGTTFKDDQGASNAQLNAGVLPTVFSGQTLNLNALGLGYAVRGHSYYSKVQLADNVTKWLTLSGDFIFEQPSTNTKYFDTYTGNSYSNALLQFYSMGQDLLTSDAVMPHSSGSLNLEFRPMKRVRILNYWMTDRLHNAAGALLTQELLSGATPLTMSQLSSADRMVVNYNQEEVEVYYDLTSHITLHGGYRYVWGDTDVRAVLSELALEPGSLSRNVGLGGFTVRFKQKLRVSGDVEAAGTNAAYFQTSLRNYQKARARASYDLSSNWRLSADFSLLNNSDPNPSIQNSFQSRSESMSAFWTPKSKLFNVLLDYTRSTVHSDILYLIPQVLQSTFSYYRDNAHTGTALVAVKWFSLGGSFVVSSGSRPIQYYQPFARVSVPYKKHVQWNTEWRWYGYAEQFYAYENFHSTQIMTSLRYTR